VIKTMRRKIIQVLILLVILTTAFFFSGKRGLACDLKITPSVFEVKSGETVEFRLERFQTHSRCLLPLEDTLIKVSGGTVVDSGEWQRGNPDILVFKVRFSGEEEPVVHIERNCPRGMYTVDARGKVIRAAVVGNGSPTNSPQPLPDDGATTLSVARDSADTTQTKNTVANNLTKEAADVEAQTEPVEAIGPEETTGPAPKTAAESAQSSRMTDLGDELNPFWINLLLWALFIGLGLTAFLLKLGKIRRTLLLLSLIVLGFYLGGCPEPVGMVFNLFSGKNVPGAIVLFLLIIPVLISLVWGRVFCGWVCPIGAAQELLHVSKMKEKVPVRVDRALKWLKYPVLLLFAYLSWKAGQNIFCAADPFKVLFNFNGTVIATIALIIILGLSLFVKRPFCRYVCPYGAVLALTAKLSLRKVKLAGDKCVGCAACAKAICPMNAITTVNSDNQKPVIDNSECIRCRECYEACKRGAISPE
jgi:Pyruvate/2-oxoacid:ferredoxin oxidoreductase delta subunit